MNMCLRIRHLTFGFVYDGMEEWVTGVECCGMAEALFCWIGFFVRLISQDSATEVA